MLKRPGVTIMEVLAASLVLVVAMVGISSAVSGALRKAKSPGQVEAAALLSAERLNYFRSQVDPYRAAGGTHYSDPDINRIEGNHSSYNGNPRLFVREYLYGVTPNEAKRVIGNPDIGLENQRRRSLTGDGAGGWALNQIPVTEAGISRVLPNVDLPNQVAAAALVTIPGATEIRAPRANANLPPAAGAAIPPDVKFVREVWIQTHFPDSLNFTVWGPAALVMNPPFAARNLPPYTVALTVRVFARDARMTLYSQTTPPPVGSGLGYDRRKPLASIVGYFGLRRN